MPSNCEVRIIPADQPGGTATIEVSGEIDGAAKGVLPAAYADAVATGDPSTVLLDFHQTDYINSTGIAVIVGVLAQARAEGRTIAAAGLTEHYRHIFTITRLVDFIQLIDPAESNAAPAVAAASDHSTL